MFRINCRGYVASNELSVEQKKTSICEEEEEDNDDDDDVA
jgi:hypothetical protein